MEQESLQSLVEVKERELQDKEWSGSCLFCKRTVRGLRSQLFNHFWKEHNFHLGHPDNLVHIDELLAILKERLHTTHGCLYCDKVFPDYPTLRLHMRKKKHLRIDVRNKTYDRFYLVNRVQDGGAGRALASDDDSDVDEGFRPGSGSERADYDEEDEAELADRFDDWTESVQQKTLCLFCSEELSGVRPCLEHMQQQHGGFDLEALAREWSLDFLACVKVVNYVRKCVAEKRCWHCKLQCASQQELLQHAEQQQHFGVQRDADFFEDVQSLFPVLEGDPLLQYEYGEDGAAGGAAMGADDAEDVDEESEEERPADSQTFPQTCRSVLMVSPTAYRYNSEIEDNAFMHEEAVEEGVLQQIVANHTAWVEALRQRKVHVLLYDHKQEHETPDAVFPNNWFSSHRSADGRSVLVLYPMKHESRRRERRPDIVTKLRSMHAHCIDLTRFEEQDEALEGTGSLVLDRPRAVLFMARSQRSSEKVLQEWKREMDAVQQRSWKMVAFDAVDGRGQPIYHTNVLMALGSNWAVVCAAAIANEEQRMRVMRELQAGGRSVIDISVRQMESFGGNILEVADHVIMSQSARNAFSTQQLAVFDVLGKRVLALPLEQLQRLSGGGIRCCVAELFAR